MYAIGFIKRESGEEDGEVADAWSFMYFRNFTSERAGRGGKGGGAGLDDCIYWRLWKNCQMGIDDCQYCSNYLYLF
jgi:hypothetical protein